jgi:hypothetical protein
VLRHLFFIAACALTPISTAVSAEYPQTLPQGFKRALQLWSRLCHPSFSGSKAVTEPVTRVSCVLESRLPQAKTLKNCRILNVPISQLMPETPLSSSEVTRVCEPYWHSAPPKGLNHCLIRQ